MTWHPVALSIDIEAKTSAGLKLHDRELVVWRDDKGAAHVWEDRCPHRGMRLSFGFVRGDHLACLYHGWQYDHSGQCRYIPAHPDLEVPATIAVPTFRTREWAGIIWTSLDDEDMHGEAAEDIPATPVRSVYIGSPAADVMSALMKDGLGAANETKALGDNLCLLKSEAGQILAALQPVAKDRTGLHVVLLESAAPENLVTLAFDTEAFRGGFGKDG